MKAAGAAAEARLNDALVDANNSTAVLRAELEEGAKARQAAEDRAAHLEAEQKEYDQLVMQTDTLAFRKFFSFLFRFSLISLYFPEACPYLFSFSRRALSGFAASRAEEGGRAPGSASIQEP
jgi:hypothetical protein